MLHYFAVFGEALNQENVHKCDCIAVVVGNQSLNIELSLSFTNTSHPPPPLRYFPEVSYKKTTWPFAEWSNSDNIFLTM